MQTSLSGRSPVVGDTLSLNGSKFEITDRSTYRNNEGYFVTEFCAEDDDTENYLLRESYPNGAVKWFFTRWQEPDGFKDDSGREIRDYLKNSEFNLPQRITYKGEQFMFADKTDGIYADNPGEDEKKITYDYWNGDHTRNLAIESWEDGSMDFYIGSYIEPSQGLLEQGSSFSRRSRSSDDEGNSPFSVFISAVIIAVIFLPELSFIPVDTMLSGALCIMAVGLFIWSATRNNITSGVTAVITALGLGAGFDRFAPLGTWQGAAMLLLAPFILCRLTGEGVRKGRKARLCALMLAAPVLAAGLRRYYSYAPEPHSPGQFLLAVAPALICGVFGYILALFIIPDTAAEQQS